MARLLHTLANLTGWRWARRLAERFDGDTACPFCGGGMKEHSPIWAERCARLARVYGRK